jgi:hypothetical protein
VSQRQSRSNKVGDSQAQIYRALCLRCTEFQRWKLVVVICTSNELHMWRELSNTLCVIVSALRSRLISTEKDHLLLPGEYHC